MQKLKLKRIINMIYEDQKSLEVKINFNNLSLNDLFSEIKNYIINNSNYMINNLTYFK